MKHRRENPIHKAVRSWAASANLPEDLVSVAPKRFTIYEPMVLLPSGSFTSPAWALTLEHPGINALWPLILAEIAKNEGNRALTHLAVNEGIPLHSSSTAGENILRSPSGLRMLHGDFGPATGQDFEGAFWVSTRQNGIRQVWAPRWTMFSRGNVKEKARLLGFPAATAAATAGPGQQDGQRWAVDLYAGIGYFVFSYAALGFRVLCWEMNPWSVEGLRRGAEANGWGVRVVVPGATKESGTEESGRQEDEVNAEVEELVRDEDGPRIIVLLEDNQRAEGRLRALQTAGAAREVSHVNLGMLPTSEPTWDAAWEITRHTRGEAWLHLHDNVGVDNVQTRAEGIQQRFEGRAAGEGSRRPRVSHVEQVKTYAPGVWHCVFDVHITSDT